MVRAVLTAVLATLAACAGPHQGDGTGANPQEATNRAPDTVRDLPAASQDDPPWFAETAAEAGVNFVHDSGHRDQLLFPEMMNGGAALFDMDGDEDLDLYLVQAGPVEASPADRRPNRLYRNNGNGTFEDVTDGSGAGDRGFGIGAATGDIDNDGDVDLYITNLGPNVLLENDGTGRFTDVTEVAGVAGNDFSASAGFLDYDRDGFLDLYVVNDLVWSVESERECYADNGVRDYCGPTAFEAPAPDRLYRNVGDGTFEDVSQAAGLLAHFGNGLGLVTVDVDSDGWTDVFVANDGTPDQLWRNNSNGTFTDIAARWGVAIDESGKPKAGMGTTAADLNHDGAQEILVVNLIAETDSLYRHAGEFFVDVTAQSQLASITRNFTRFGVGFHDFDNDGRDDIYYANGRVKWHSEMYSESDPYAEPNVLVRGTVSEDDSATSIGRFTEVRPRGGTASDLAHTSRAAAFGDINHDGGVDVVVVNRDASPYVLLNVVPNRGNWLSLRLVSAEGRDALGARVTVEAGGVERSREVRTAYSYAAANDPRLHFGLGPTTGSVDTITVYWVSGDVERFPGPHATDQVLILREGTGERRD